MTEEGTIPGKKNREAIPEMLVRIVRRHRRPRNDMRVTGRLPRRFAPRNDRGCDEVHSKDDTERNQDA